MSYDILEPEQAAGRGYDVIDPAPATATRGYDVIEPEVVQAPPVTAEEKAQFITPKLPGRDLSIEDQMHNAFASTQPRPRAKAIPTFGDMLANTAVGQAASQMGKEIISPALSMSTRLAEAVPADLMAKVAGTPEYGGNIDAALTGPKHVPAQLTAMVDPFTAQTIVGTGEPAKDVPAPQLPISKAIEQAQEESKFRGEFPWASLGAKTSLGFFGAVPKIAAVAALPESLPAQMAASGALFSVDDEGKFHPEEVPFNAMLPGVGKAARVATGAAIGAAISKGASALENPVAQKVLEELGDQAGMNAFMAAQQSPQLMDLYQKDRNAFYQQLVGMVGQNLAFRIGLGGIGEFSPDRQSQTRNFIENNAEMFTRRTIARLAGGDLARQLQTGDMGQPGPIREPTQEDTSSPAGFAQQVPQRPDLIDFASNLKSRAGEQSPEKSEQVAPAGAQPVETQAPEKGTNVPLPGGNRVAAALAEMMASARQTTPAEPPAADTAQKNSIPEENLNQEVKPALTAQPVSETNVSAAPETITGRTAREGTEEQTGSPPESGSMPAEEGSGPSRSVAVLPKKSQAELQRPWDLIDEVQGQHGTIDPSLIKEANPDWKPVGAARKIFKKGGQPADTVADALFQSGMFKGDPGQVDQLGDALNAAAKARKGWRSQFSKEKQATELEGKQASAFSRDVKRPGPKQEDLVSDTLNEGDEFTLRGAKVKVTKMEFDDEGRVQSVELDDGKKYGTQHVGSETVLKIDKDSYQRAGEETAKAPADPVVDFLNSLKSPTEGRVQAFGLAPMLWNKLIDGVIAAVRGGRAIRDAVSAALDKFKAEHPGVQFDEAGAREHLEKTPVGSLRYESPEGKPTSPAEAMKARRAQIDERLQEIQGEASKAQKKFTNLSPDLRSERFQLNKERRELTNRLLKDPAYVRELLLQEASKGAEFQAAKASGNAARAREIVEENLRGPGDVKTELERVAPELHDQVRKQLEGEGKLKPTPATEPGRSLNDLTAWLKKNKLDSPGLTLAERLSLRRRLQDTWEKGKSFANRSFDQVMSAWEAFKAQYKSPPKDDDVRSLRKDWLFMKQQTGQEVQHWLDAIDKEVPRPDRQQALSIYLDAGRDENVLRAQLDEVPDKWKSLWKTALSLTPKEKELATRLALEFNRKLSDGQLVGIIDRGREDYGVPQIWKKGKEPKFNTPYDPADPQFKRQGSARSLRGSVLDTRDPFFALQRKVPSYFDGIMAGGEPESLKIRDLVGVYNAQFHDALADRGYVWALRDAKMPDGEPVVYLSGGVRTEPGENGGRRYFVDSAWRQKEAMSKDGRPYVSLDHPALKGWKFASVDANKNPILVNGDFMVHPDAVMAINRDLGRSALRDPNVVGAPAAKAFSALLNSTVFMKASKFAAATFHGFTLAEHLMTHAFAGMPTRERLSLLNPSVRGVEIDPAKNADLALLMRNGTYMGFDGQRHLFEEGLASHGGLLEHVPYLGDVLKGTTKFVFENYLPRLKAKLGTVLLQANRARYSKELSDDQVAELTSNQVNAAFGGQNWRLMGTSKTMLDVNRILFTAPDFLLSRMKVLGQALKPYNAEQRAFLVAQAALVYAGARVLNALFSKDHDPHFEPQLWDKVVVGNRAYSGRFLVSDISNMIQDPVTFASGRVGPWPKTVIDGLVQRDWKTGARIDVPFKTDSRALRAVQIMAKDAGSWMLPVGTEGFLPGAAGREQSKGSQVAQAVLGLGSRKYNSETQMFDAAAAFNKKGNTKAQAYQEQRDNEAQTASKYRKLSSLLDAGDLAGARNEYKALLSDGATAQSVLTHYQGVFRPFTGSAQRELQFKQSLPPNQLAVYNQAISDRRARLANFRKISNAGAQ